MTKREIIRQIHDSTDYNFSEIEEIVDVLFDKIAEGLVVGDKVVISGFGTFEKYFQEGHDGVNPYSGEPIFIEGIYKIRFCASRVLKKRLK